MIILTFNGRLVQEIEDSSYILQLPEIYDRARIDLTSRSQYALDVVIPNNNNTNIAYSYYTVPVFKNNFSIFSRINNDKNIFDNYR